MSVFIVTITGVTNPIEVYGGTAAATDYIGAMFSEEATAWLALAPDDKARTLVGATRYLNRLRWLGTRTGIVDGSVIPPGVATTMQWPRIGVTLSDGTPVDSTTVPADVVQAAFELAVLVADDPDVIASSGGDGSNIQSVEAGGGVGVAYFNPTSASTGTASQLPGILDGLLGQYLAIASSAAGTTDGGLAGNGGCESQFNNLHGWGRWRPF
jgi:hypothetical protein